MSQYGFKKNLKGKSRIKSLCLFIDGLESMDEFKKLHQYPELEDLSLLSAKKLTAIPEEIATLKKLNRLRISDSQITEIPNFIFDLPLMSLKISDSPLNALPEAISKLTQLEEIELDGLLLEQLPIELGDLVALKNLDIRKTPLKKIPDVFEKLKNLEHLRLIETQLKELPKSITKLKNIKGITVMNAQIKALPKGLGNLQNLQYFHFSENLLTEFPSELCKIYGLYNVRLDHNKIKEVPECITHWKELHSLDLKNNAFEEYPDVLLEWDCAFGTKAHWFLSIDKHLYYEKPIWELFRKNAYKSLDRKDKRHYFYLFTQDIPKIKTIPSVELIALLNAKVTEVADNTVRYLTSNSDEILKKGDNVLISCKIEGDKKKLIERLISCGIEVVTSYEQKPTHVVIRSRGNNHLERIPKKTNFQFITEHHLTKTIDALDPGYLVEASLDPQQDHIADLIFSMDDANMALALELLQGGGLPPGLFTHVYIIFKLCDDASVREKAGKMLKKHADVAMMKAVRRRFQFRISNRVYYGSREVRELKEKTLQTFKDSGLDIGLFSYAMAIKYDILTDMALDHVSTELQSRLIEKKIRQSRFKLNYHEELQHFPLGLCRFKNLKEICIDVQRGYWQNGSYQLNEDGFKIPPQIEDLAQLEVLDLRGPVASVPWDHIKKLKKLKQLSFWTQQLIDRKKIEKDMPGCSFDIRYIE